MEVEYVERERATQEAIIVGNYEMTYTPTQQDTEYLKVLKRAECHIDLATADENGHYHYLFVHLLRETFPNVGIWSGHTKKVFDARTVSTKARDLIDAYIIANVRTFTLPFSFQYDMLVSLQVVPHLFTGLKKLIVRDASMRACYLGSVALVQIRKRIEELDLSHCSTVSDEYVAILENLRVLNLSDSGSSSLLIGTCFESISSTLRKLNLTKNTCILGSRLLALTGLEELKLGGNMLVKDEHLIHMVPTLRSLNLNGCYNVSDQLVGQLTNLEKLSFYGRMIAGNELSKLTNLKKLDLSYVACITNKDLSTLTSLESLNIENNKRITHEGLEPFLHSLKEVKLGGNYVLFEPDVWLRCPNLQTIYCRYAYVEVPSKIVRDELLARGVRFMRDRHTHSEMMYPYIKDKTIFEVLTSTVGRQKSDAYLKELQRK